MIKRHKIDTTFETNILRCFVCNTEFIKQIKDIYKPDFLDVNYSNIIVSWCLEYYNKYEKAPNSDIQDMFDKWAEKNYKAEDTKVVQGILDKLLTHEYTPENVDYFVNETIDYFKKKSAVKVAEQVKLLAEDNQIEKAEQLITAFQKVEKVKATGIDPFLNPDATKEAFTDTAKPLFKLKGALGELLNPELTRASFVCFMAQSKGGKSWWLQELAMEAHKQQLNVAMFLLGDMSRPQFIRRQHIYLAKKSDKEKFCKQILIPVLDCKHNQDNSCTKQERVCDFGILREKERCTFYEVPNYSPCTYCYDEEIYGFHGATWFRNRPECQPLTEQEGQQNIDRYVKRYKPKHFKVESYPRRSMTVQKCEQVLEKWEQEIGGKFDVVVFDYLELCDAKGKTVEREIQNEIAGSLNGLAKKKDYLIITATQAKGEAYEKDSLSLSSYSEDKRKYDHVTCMLALQQTKEEKEQGIMRVSKLLAREDAVDGHQVKVGYSLAIGRPHLFSYD